MLWLWIFICVVALAIGGYFLFKGDEIKPAPVSDTIVITDEGSKRETYIEMPNLMHCYGVEGDPSFCADINPETEMNYVYDPLGGSVSAGGSFKTTWDKETNLCSDGTTDCIYEEKFSKDGERKLIGITNAKGEDFIQKFIDDIWSGRVNLENTSEIDENGKLIDIKELIKSVFQFNRDTGELYMTEGATKVKIIPGNALMSNKEVDGKMVIPVGIMILYIIFYYYGNDLPKPIIKLDLRSEKTLGELYLAMVEERAKQTQP